MSDERDETDIADVMEQKAKGTKTSLGDAWDDLWCLAAAAELRRLRAREEVLVEALRPFARIGDEFPLDDPRDANRMVTVYAVGGPDSYHVRNGQLAHADFQAARAALAPSEPREGRET